MAKTTYSIEQMDKRQRWFVIGSCDMSALAQKYMREYQTLFPNEAFRVTERPSGKLIVLHDPRASAETAA